jgi:hypothetical protein
MVDIRSLISQIPMEPGYVPAPPEPDLSVIQRLMGLPQTLRAVGQNMAVGAASLPVGVYKGFGNPAAGEAAMSQFQQEYGYTPTNPAAQRQLQGLGEFLQQLETEYKIPPIMAPIAATPALGIRGLTPQTQTLARDLVRDIQTTPPTGAVTMAPAPSIPKSDIGFYSQLEAAVQPLQNKGTGQQYLAQIQKSAGVKPEEIQWTGLDTFLQGRQSVTKQEIQDYLNANRVDVQEVRLDRSLPAVQAERRGAFDAYDRGEITLEQRNAILEQSEPVNTRHHLGAYQGIKTEIPGGENYRELLLTLPQKGGVDVKAAEQTRDTLARQTADLMEEWKRLSEEMPGDPRVVELYGRLSETRRARDQAVVDARELRKAAESQTYRSTHFDQPNILAHLRVNDRTVDGKKTLFVEEIQSDWHQAGRKKGYKSEIDPNENTSLVKQYDSLTAERRQIEGIVATGDDASPVTQNAIQKLNQINAELTQISDRLSEIRTAATEGVPDAPFKTSWHELSLKRAIQEAAEKGYDQIAFTTGKTQAERYDLSKQVDSLLYSKNPDGTYRVSAQVQGRGQMMGESIPESDLADYVGKEVAEKMAKGTGKQIQVAGKYDPVSMTSDTTFMTELSGEGLKVGGEGMKGFYDNILPKSLDKLGKKFGAKVGKTEMDGVEVWQMDITPQMRESVTTKGQPLFAVPAIGAGLLGAGMMQEEEQF